MCFNFADEVDVRPASLQEGGLILTILFKRPLLIPVNLRLVYRDVDSSQQLTLQSGEAFYNTSFISYFVYSSSVPTYRRFYVGVIVIYGNITGPLSLADSTYVGECSCI